MVFFDSDRWNADGGDLKLRYNYSLNSDSVVVDLGGYKGDFADIIHRKFNSNVYAFEPFKEFYDVMEGRFNSNKKIRVFNYGISDKTSTEDFHFSNDGSSLAAVQRFSEEDNKAVSKVEVRSFKEVYEELNFDVIDLLKINVEGAEYEILENIFENNYTTKIKNFQIQFHPEPPGAEEAYKRVTKVLSETHNQDWYYSWCWENWSLK
tara:strand:+ start:1633 stop:2253 length:621 start_codon:yes stop_codon:yes gene_type:complete